MFDEEQIAQLKIDIANINKAAGTLGLAKKPRRASTKKKAAKKTTAKKTSAKKPPAAAKGAKSPKAKFGDKEKALGAIARGEKS